jgi:hypothetical protein
MATIKFVKNVNKYKLLLDWMDAFGHGGEH